ncbi:uncharacterized protein F4812DRAFT_434370 [Daldinia caldariorum]|uniref:uncharacterized protein n=1 Tax=Daldinia caldariorum TaxID=326644 RepID=UPI00200755B0|nr:uncharacterized protein F4812DRAFT_434370 [Daldinia caldariorum]KAI1466512.1 hypothetical protein F4812DRAFT_434370 [Daldinia caldariorum]
MGVSPKIPLFDLEIGRAGRSIACILEGVGTLERLAKGVDVEFREDAHRLLKFFSVEDRGSAR